MESLKAIGGLLLGIALFAAGILAIVVLVRGGVWAAEHVLPWLLLIGTVAFAIDVLMLLASIVRPVRRLSAPTLFITSYLFGAILWLYGLIFTYSIWGFLGVVIGLLVLGIGVVPIGMLATLFHGMWEPFFTLVVLTILTFGLRFASIGLATSAE